MAMDAAAVQALVLEMQRINQENMSLILTKLSEGKSNGVMTDSRGIGKPTTFNGDENKYAEWKAKLLAYLRVNCRNADSWIVWAGNSTTVITEEDVDLTYPDKKDEVLNFANVLYSILMSCTEDGAFRICYSVEAGNGLEAIRLLMKRYEPRTPGTKRALLKAIINQAPAKKPDDLEKTLMHLEELIKKYEVMGGAELPEDLRVALIIDMCHKDLKEHLELTTKDMTYREVRDEIVNYAERKRNAFGNDLKAMEVDELADEYTWWGGQWQEDNNNWESEEVYAMGWQKGYGKGKGYDNSYGKGGYKGGGKDSGYKGFGKGYSKGYGKSDYKGKGFGKDGVNKGDGKGKGGGFQGYCHWCGEWGHSARFCKEKDIYMDGVRARGGKGGGGKPMDTDNVEGNQQDNNLENLEAKGGYRTLCSIESRPLCLFNRVGELEVSEGYDEDFMDPPGLGGWTPVVRKSINKAKKEVKKFGLSSCWGHDEKACAAAGLRGTSLGARTSVPPGQYPCNNRPWASTCGNANGVYKDFLRSLDNLELNTVQDMEEAEGLTITIDSGASENVISESYARRIPVVPSAGSREGVQYVAANGTTMPNKGEKHIPVTTVEGHKCLLNMQVTDVKKPLMSVARICDAGHEVTFSATGGAIKHMKTGQVTNFERVDNVYRLKVALAPGFARQGAQ